MNKHNKSKKKKMVNDEKLDKLVKDIGDINLKDEKLDKIAKDIGDINLKDENEKINIKTSEYQKINIDTIKEIDDFYPNEFIKFCELYPV